MKMRRLATFLIVLFPAVCTLLAQDPDIEANERSAMEDFFRTSEQPGETPANARQRRGNTKRVSVPKGAARIGCVCMDDSRSPARSIGACSGHGGVRYWLYLTPEGDTVRVLTARHEFHPHPLDSTERTELVQAQEQRRQSPANTAAAPTILVLPLAYTTPSAAVPAPAPAADWPEVAGLTAGGVLLVIALRLMLGWADKHMPLFSDALHYLLRSRRRRPPH